MKTAPARTARRTRQASSERTRTGPYVYRAVLADRQTVEVSALTFLDAVLKVGGMSGSPTGDDVLGIEYVGMVGCDRRSAEGVKHV